ncbi:MAG: restriction endonuclease subunit S, partial [Paludibacteraceae bacterium]|nr:restriction endonuclease subunit S [Paludibacteraceae bacterium]
QADKSEFDGIKSQFIEEIGDPRTNPKNWPIKKLSELSTYSIGLTYKPEDVSEDGIIVLRSGNIQESKLTLTDTVRVNCQIKESLYVKEDDILMCSRNGSAALVGKVAQIKSIDEPMTYGAFMTIIQSEYSDYLFLYFQSNAFREQVSTGKSSTMNQITQKMLDKICLPFPDEDTRKRLSAILHQADKSESAQELVRNINYN